MLYLVYGLMFTCSLAMMLYFAGLGVKLAVRLRNPMSRAVMTFLVPLSVALPGFVLSRFARNICDPYFMADCTETGGVELTWLYWALIGWTIASALGGLVVLAMGFRNKGWTPASNEWHAEGLFFRTVIYGVLTVALFFGADTLVTRELRKEHAWYQRLHEWTEPLPQKDGEEGREAYMAAYNAMQQIFGNSPDSESSLPEWWDSAFDPTAEFDATAYEVRKFVWDNKPVYDLIANAASATALDMPRDDLDSNTQRLDPHSMAKMLQLRARVSAGRGWFISSMRDITNILRIEDHHRDTMGFMGYLYALGLRGRALYTFEDIVSNPGFYGIDPVNYPEFSEISIMPEFRSHLRRQHVEDASEFLGKLVSPATKEKGQSERFRKILYRVFMARHSLGCIKSAYNAEEEAITRWPEPVADFYGRAGDCRLYQSSYGVQYLKAATRSTSSHGAELALATVKYFRRHGRYPTDLSELVPRYIDAIPADPFDGSGRMAMADEGFDLLFYSPAYEKNEGSKVGFALKKQKPFKRRSAARQPQSTEIKDEAGEETDL